MRYRAFFLLLQIGITACAGRPSQPVKVPDWALRGTVLAKEGERRVFYGVGGQRAAPSAASRKSLADRRAIQAAASAFQFYFAKLLGSYTSWSQVSRGEDAPQDQSSDIQVFVSYDAVRETVKSAEIIARWQHSSTDDQLALARIDLAAFLAAAKTSQQLEVQAKTYIAEHAEQVFRRLREGPAVEKEPGDPGCGPEQSCGQPREAAPESTDRSASETGP